MMRCADDPSPHIEPDDSGSPFPLSRAGVRVGLTPLPGKV